MNLTPALTADGITVALVVGVALGFALVGWARTKSDGGMRLYAVGLVVTVLLYVSFALLGRASLTLLGLEVLGALLYGGSAWVGYRRFGVVLALGWALHAVWDVWLHTEGSAAAYIPDWYPWFCVGVDVFVGGAVLATPRPSR